MDIDETQDYAAQAKLKEHEFEEILDHITVLGSEKKI